jgi:drug/metabolite transporter (DMT)-like permease
LSALSGLTLAWKRIPLHTQGFLITTLGILVISPDGLLTRLVEADHWTMIFWRALFLSFGTLIICGFRHVNKVGHQFRALKGTGLALIFSYSCGTISFVIAFTHTSVANTLIILSITPLFAAIISRIFLAEVIKPRTLVAIGFVAVGMFIISGGASDSQLFGDFMAMAGSFFMACSFNLVRRFPNLPIFPAISVSGLFTACLVLPLASPFSISQADLGYLMIMGLYVLPIGSVLLFLGPRYIPASEVGLLLLLESIFGSLWVFLMLKEVPVQTTIIGGAIILFALAMNAVWASRDRKMA